MESRNTSNHQKDRKRPLPKRLERWQYVPIIMLPFLTRSVTSSTITTAADATTTTTTNSHSSSAFKNPFTHGGCLYQRMDAWQKKRVCGSEDPLEVLSRGDYYCESSDPFQHMEIRLHGQNWEASLFETWILQILMSEVLQVPTSVETSMPNQTLNFYDVESRIQYGVSDDFECLNRGFEVGDCQRAKNNNDQSNNNYQSCCHFIPELWYWESDVLDPLIDNGIIEWPLPMGTIGEDHWYIPKFTAERDPTLSSYVGLAQSRQRVAERFLRPTTWRDYCSHVADCDTDGGGSGGDSNATIAQRSPAPDDPNGDRFFVPGLYQGHFRATAKNDCTNFPGSCSGHMFDYPCDWSSYARQQAYHLGIAVEGDGSEVGGGYTYEQLVDALLAANATKSDILIYWWTPEALSQQFIGTDMELTMVVFPPVTHQCLDNRVSKADRCSSAPERRVGSPLGACAGEPRSLKKMIGAALHHNDPTTPTSLAMQSPAYELLRSFQISNAEAGRLFEHGNGNNTTTKHNDPREAVCEWVIEHFDELQRFIPRTFPRVVRSGRDTMNSSVNRLELAGKILGSLAIVIVMVATWLTYRQRQRPVMQCAQLEFLTLLLAGLTLVSIGSLLMSLPASDELCVAFMWLTNFGYTLELAPLIVKMAAIHRIMRAAKHFRHVVVSRRTLFGAVVGLCAIMFCLLISMTLFDPPQLSPEYILSDVVNEAGETLVLESFFCQSGSRSWLITSVTWHLVLLLVATVQAVLTRNVRHELNDSRTLALMIYSQFIFVCLRVASLFLDKEFLKSEGAHARSIIYSMDCIVTVSVYFVPKLMSKDIDFETSEHMVESSTVKKLRMLAAVATAQHERQMRRLQRDQDQSCEILAGDDEDEEGQYGRSHPDLFGGRSSPHMSIPPDDFEEHIRNVDPATFAAALTGMGNVNNSRDVTSEITTPTESDTASRKCRHCGKYD